MSSARAPPLRCSSRAVVVAARGGPPVGGAEAGASDAPPSLIVVAGLRHALPRRQHRRHRPHRRVPHQEAAPAVRRSVLGEDERVVNPRQPLEEVPRVAHRRRAADHRRRRAVHGCEAAQAAEDARNVRSEDASVHVRPVDDDQAERREDVRPLGVAGEQRAVEHVRVGDDHARVGAHVRPLRLRRVAVVSVDAHTEEGGRTGGAQRPKCAQLVLREGLGREEVQAARRRVGRERAAPQVAAERLPDAVGVQSITWPPPSTASTAAA